jgi:N-methylhydantoinase A
VVLSEGAARAIAAESIGVAVAATAVVAATDRMRVIQAVIAEPSVKERRPVRAVDLEGVIRIQRSDARVARSSAEQGLDALRRVWAENTIRDGNGEVVPDMFIIIGAHIVDLTGIVSLDQALAIVRTEFEGLVPDTTIVLVAATGARR